MTYNCNLQPHELGMVVQALHSINPVGTDEHVAAFEHLKGRLTTALREVSPDAYAALVAAGDVEELRHRKRRHFAPRKRRQEASP